MESERNTLYRCRPVPLSHDVFSEFRNHALTAQHMPAISHEDCPYIVAISLPDRMLRKACMNSVSCVTLRITVQVPRETPAFRRTEGRKHAGARIPPCISSSGLRAWAVAQCLGKRPSLTGSCRKHPAHPEDGPVPGGAEIRDVRNRRAHGTRCGRFRKKRERPAIAHPGTLPTDAFMV